MFEYTFELPANGDSGDAETVTLQFKPITEVPIGILRKYRADAEGQMWATFEWALGDQLELFDRLPGSAIEAIMTGWQKGNGQGVTVGESSASSTSSTSTGRRSKRTSSVSGSD